MHPIFDAETIARGLGKVSSNYNFLGSVKLSDCSGSIVRFEKSKDNDRALVLSNGHCVNVKGETDGMMPANQYLVHVKSRRSFKVLNADGTFMDEPLFSTELLYATNTWHDVSLYQLALTYAEIKKKYKVNAFTLSSEHPKLSEPVDMLSGYWQKGYSCTLEKFVHELHEGEYVSLESMRYSLGGCDCPHGSSGSPIISQLTGEIVGVNSTGNDDGKKCTMDNPCEVSESGEIYFEKGRSYADQTYLIYSCLDSNNRFEVHLPNCQLYH